MPLIRRYLITGLLIWVPLVITAWVLHTLVSTLDQTLLLLPPQWQPKHLGITIPGLGAVLTFLILFITGILATNFVGQRLVAVWEKILQQIPVVKTIYTSVKQVSDTLLAGNGQAFRQAVLVRYPHGDSWTIAFLTGKPSLAVSPHLAEEHLNVYVPTTPNPTSGFFLMVPKSSVIELEMTVDEALKHIISMGVVDPIAQRRS